MVEIYFDNNIKDFVDRDFYTGLNDREFINIVGPQVGLIDYLDKKETIRQHLIKLFTNRFNEYPSKVEVNLSLSRDGRDVVVNIFLHAYYSPCRPIIYKLEDTLEEEVKVEIIQVEPKYYSYRINSKTLYSMKANAILEPFRYMLNQLKF